MPNTPCPVTLVDIKLGNAKEFESLIEAAEHIGVTYQAIQYARDNDGLVIGRYKVTTDHEVNRRKKPYVPFEKKDAPVSRTMLEEDLREARQKVDQLNHYREMDTKRITNKNEAIRAYKKELSNMSNIIVELRGELGAQTHRAEVAERETKCASFVAIITILIGLACYLLAA